MAYFGYRLLGRSILRTFRLIVVVGYWLLVCLFPIRCIAMEEQTTVIITDVEGLKGIWQALYWYQQSPARDRINTFRHPLPERREFESEAEYQKRTRAIKEEYERRIEEQLRNEIRKEEEFKNTVFILKLTHIPYILSQDSTRKYFYHTNEYGESLSNTGTRYSERGYRGESRKTGKTIKKKVKVVDTHTPDCYQSEERRVTLRRKIGTAGERTPPGEGGGYVFGAIFARPSLYNYKIEEKNFTFSKRAIKLTFSLQEYDIEQKRFPISFPFSEAEQGEKQWEYYTGKRTEWEHYSRSFRRVRSERVEKWTIKFDRLPTYIPFPVNRAKEVGESERDLALEVVFQPVRATKEVTLDGTYYNLEVELRTVALKDAEELLYAGKGEVWKDEEFAKLPPKTDRAGWTIKPKYFDDDPVDGINDPGSPSNPWIVKPQDPKYGSTYEVSTKYFYGWDFASRKGHYYKILPGKVALSLIPAVAYLRGSFLFSDRWAYGVTALGLYYTNFWGEFSAPGQPANPYIIRKVEE